MQVSAVLPPAICKPSGLPHVLQTQTGSLLAFAGASSGAALLLADASPEAAACLDFCFLRMRLPLAFVPADPFVDSSLPIYFGFFGFAAAAFASDRFCCCAACNSAVTSAKLFRALATGVEAMSCRFFPSEDVGPAGAGTRVRIALFSPRLPMFMSIAAAAGAAGAVP